MNDELEEYIEKVKRAWASIGSNDGPTTDASEDNALMEIIELAVECSHYKELIEDITKVVIDKRYKH